MKLASEQTIAQSARFTYTTKEAKNIADSPLLKNIICSFQWQFCWSSVIGASVFTETLALLWDCSLNLPEIRTFSAS